MNIPDAVLFIIIIFSTGFLFFYVAYTHHKEEKKKPSVEIESLDEMWLNVNYTQVMGGVLLMIFGVLLTCSYNGWV